MRLDSTSDKTRAILETFRPLYPEMRSALIALGLLAAAEAFAPAAVGGAPQVLFLRPS